MTLEILSHWPISAQESQIVAVWHGNGRRESTILAYLQWVRRFEAFCAARDLDPDEELTLQGVTAFARIYAGERGVDLNNAIRCACIALRAWSYGVHSLGRPVAQWCPPTPPRALPALLCEYAEYRRHHCGAANASIKRDVDNLSAFLEAVCGPERSLSEIRLADIDAFTLARTATLSRKSVARICCSIRAFLRFLHATGRLSHDLAPTVVAPIVRAAEQPPRTIAWDDVRKVLQAIDTRSCSGLRDAALLLMMATYGMGAAEVLHLRLEDIDWRTGTIHLVRPKTGAQTLLPLLPTVRDVLIAYLQKGRPRHTAAREIFVRIGVPHGQLSSGAIRHIVRKHATAAGITASILGGHLFRHCHATFQIEQGAPPKVVSDILGHQDPSSTSAYVRVATTRLRALALPVPR